MINWILGILIVTAVIFISGRGIYNLKHPEKAVSSCGCGGSCSSCSSNCSQKEII